MLNVVSQPFGNPIALHAQLLELRAQLAEEQRRAELCADIAAKLREGAVGAGGVTNMTDYGAFVELEPGVEGYLPRSALPIEEEARIEDPGGQVRAAQGVGRAIHLREALTGIPAQEHVLDIATGTGDLALAFEAEDGLGNVTAGVTLTLVVDNHGPAWSFTPASGSAVQEDTLVVTGTVTDLAGVVSATFDGEELAVVAHDVVGEDHADRDDESPSASTGSGTDAERHRQEGGHDHHARTQRQRVEQ